MKYYEQLLESFNKLKKRTFKLTVLEQEDPTNAIIALFSNAQKGDFQPLPPPLDSFKVRISDDNSINVMDLSMQRQAKVTNPQRQRVEETGTATEIWQNMIAAFTGQKQGTQTGPGQTPPGQTVVTPRTMPTPPGQAAMENGFTDPELIGPGNLFEEMRNKASKLCDKLLEMGIDKSCNHFLNYFGGAASQSPEKAFAPNRTKWSYDEEYKILTKSKLEEQESKEAIKSIDWLLDQLNSGNLIDGVELNKRFAVAGDGSVLITIGSESGEGYILKDKPGVHKALLYAAMEKVDPTSVPEDFQLNTFTPRVSSGAARGIRGKMLEEVYMLRTLAKHCAATRNKGEELSSPACIMFKAASERFQKHKDNWPLIHEWAAQHDLGAAIKLDESGLYEVVKNSGIQGENLVNIVGAMFALSEKVDDVIGATMSVPVGLNPGEGEKPDVTYVWSTEKEARTGLKSLGFSDDEINGGMLKEGTVGEAFKGSAIPDLEQYYRDNHDPEGTDRVFYHGTGLKHFEGGMHGMHAGVRQHGSLTKTMNEGTQMRTRATEYFGHSPEEAKAVDTYFKDKLNGILEGVKETITLKDVEDPSNSKKTIQKDPLLDLINSHIGATKTNSNYHELRHDGLKHFMEKYVSNKGRWINKKMTVEEREYISEAISRQLMWRRMNTDLHSEDSTTRKTALDTLSTVAFITGGAFDDNTSTSVRDLESFGHMSIIHNEGMDFVKQAQDPNSNIEIVQSTGADADEFGEGTSVKFRDKTNHDSYVTLRLSKDKGEPKWAVEYSLGFLQAHDRVQGSQPSLQAASTKYGNVENMIQEYLDNQKDMLIKILSS